MKDNLSISALQFNIVWENHSPNFHKIEQLLANNFFSPQLIVLPEMFSSGFTMDPLKVATTMNGEVVEWMKELAYKEKAVIAGSAAIIEEGKVFNRFLAVFPNGKINHCDKRHLFRMSGEHQVYSPGQLPDIINIDKWRIVPFICYDLRFPVWCRNKNHYDIALYIANWPHSRSHVWKTLLAARAIENQCYVVGVNRTGTDANGINYNGDSRLIDFKGECLTGMPGPEEGVVNWTVEHSLLQIFREKFPVWKDADNFSINL